MSDVIIVTDSNSGVPREKAAELGIGVVPMPFLVNGKTYFEGVDGHGPVGRVSEGT